MAVKSSENENMGFYMSVTKPLKSGRDHRKDHESGRDEVASFDLCTFLLSTATFFLFCQILFLP